MEGGISRRVWAALGIGIATVVGLGLLLALLGRGPGESAPMITPATSPVPDDPVVASIVFGQDTHHVTHALWQEALLLDQVLSGLAGQPAPAPSETLDRLINAELVLHEIPQQAPTPAQVEAQITALKQTWGVDDAAVIAVLEKVGLTREAFERAVSRSLMVQAGLAELESQGYDATAWLEEQRASVEIAINQAAANASVPYVPITHSPLATESIPPTPPLAPATEAHPTQAALSPLPTPDRAIPEVAPDFTLARANGEAFTLTEQLAEGPVVLIFFHRHG
jgi:hypothetical protein